MIRIRVRTPHVVGAGGEWEFHEWFFDGGELRADRLGRANPRMTFANWFTVCCNNPDCPARAVIAKDDVLGLLPPAPQSKPLGVAP